LLPAFFYPSEKTGMNIDDLCINTIRMLSVDMVQEANSGHPGVA